MSDILYQGFSSRRRALVRMTADGIVEVKRTRTGAWTVIARKKADVPFEQWRARKQEWYDNLPAWAKDMDTLPSSRQIDKWAGDVLCKTPTGHRVEPDGVGPDGVPSWLVLLGLI